jgi:hypothetical protein
MHCKCLKATINTVINLKENLVWCVIALVLVYISSNTRPTYPFSLWALCKICMNTSAQQYIHRSMHGSNVSGTYTKSDIVEQKKNG